MINLPGMTKTFETGNFQCQILIIELADRHGVFRYAIKGH